eukprot:TRINITY_DN7369_c0_g1_i2.p1 TRINITY_DN7369_c0_g1~~TRINITY_DN7369_c0_g1_i2.p1  ORF type:complete len:385 (+),score=58.92 TRINITY_DN7369_c0_g1_i2:151-1305(+)
MSAIKASTSPPRRQQPFASHLLKRGKYNKDWKERWCVYVDQKIFYYRSQNQPKAISFIPLERAHARVCKDPLISSENPNCFEIVTYSRVYYMSAITQKLMYEWINMVTMSSDLMKENMYFEQIEDAIETASIERSRLLLERSSSRASTMMGGSPSSRLTLTNNAVKDTLSISPENVSIPQSPFKKISSVPTSMSPPPALSNKELLLQQHSAAQTRNRYLGILQLRPKAPPTPTNINNTTSSSVSPPNVLDRVIPPSASLADFRSYQPKVSASHSAGLPGSVSHPEASLYGSNNNNMAASMPRSSSGFMYSPATGHSDMSQANNSPQLFGDDGSGNLERGRASTFKDRIIGEDRTVNSDPLGRFTVQKPHRKTIASSLELSLIHI